MRFKTVLAVLLAVVLWPSPALANDASLKTVGRIDQYSPFGVDFRGPLGPPLGSCLLATSSKVEFRWDGIFLYSGQASAYCMVDFGTKVPAAKNAPGTHTITATYQTNDGVKHTIKKTVTVEGSVRPTPKPTSRKTSKPVPKPSASSSAPASPSPSASEVAPSPSDSPTAAVSLVPQSSASGDGGTGWLPLGIGGALMLIGGGLLFWLIRRRRSGEGSEAAE